MAITEQGKVRARSHMGYGGVQAASTFFAGVPAATQTSFMIEGAMNRLLPEAEGSFYVLLDKLDAVEAQIEGDMENIAAVKVGDIEVNLEEFEGLIKFYKYWQGKLANLLQVPPNQYDQREWLGEGWGGSNGLNVRVNHG